MYLWNLRAPAWDPTNVIPGGWGNQPVVKLFTSGENLNHTLAQLKSFYSVGS